MYNRWGELVFETNEAGKGWDGKIKGYEQGSQTLAYVTEGVDYLGNNVFKKGTITLIK